MSFAVEIVTADKYSEMLEACSDSCEIAMNGLRGKQMKLNGEIVLAIQGPMTDSFNIVRFRE